MILSQGRGHTRSDNNRSSSSSSLTSPSSSFLFISLTAYNLLLASVTSTTRRVVGRQYHRAVIDNGRCFTTPPSKPVLYVSVKRYASGIFFRFKMQQHKASSVLPYITRYSPSSFSPSRQASQVKGRTNKTVCTFFQSRFERTVVGRDKKLRYGCFGEASDVLYSHCCLRCHSY